MKKHDPATSREWQEAVDTAWVLTLIDAARAYGLINGGLLIDIERCNRILTMGEKRGFFPARDAVERVLCGPEMSHRVTEGTKK